MSVTKSQYYQLGGGEDLKTPPLTIKPGRALIALNYDIASNGGYKKIDGIERFDGHPRPSDARFYGFVVSGNVNWVAGNVVGGVTIVSVAPYGAGTDTIVTVRENPSFTAGQVLSNGVTSGTLTSNSIPLLSVNDAQFNFSQDAAVEGRRAVITAVPGSGPVRGVWMFEGNVYAVRNNAGGTAGVMHKSTATGWQPLALGSSRRIDTGSREIFRNDIITGATSGATARVAAVSRSSGQWSGSFVGDLYVVQLTGVFTVNENLLVGGLVAARFTGLRVLSLPPGGRYRVDEYNFFADPTGNAVYGVNGVGRAFAFDGTTYSEIETGTPIDTPSHVNAHRNILFLGFPGGSLQFSNTGLPHNFEALLGAGEIGIGSEITGLVSVAETLIVFGQDRINILYGTDKTNFDLRPFSRDTGSALDAQQQMGPVFFLDQRGLTSMVSGQEFANFVTDPISNDIDPYLLKQLPLSVCSSIYRQENIYRLYFSDGSGVTMVRKNNQLAGFTRLQLPVTPVCAFTGLDSQNVERVFLGADNGFVYEMERGNSFDGDSIKAYLRLAFNQLGSPRVRKRFKKLVLELAGFSKSTIRVFADFSYGNSDAPAVTFQDINIIGGGGFYDLANWSEFLWSAQPVPELEARIDGTGKNISFFLDGSGKDGTHTFSGIIITYIDRREIR